MDKELTTLCSIYKEYKNAVTFREDNSETIEFDEKVEDEHTISISMNKINNTYYIFLYVEKDSKLIFKGLLQSDEKMLNGEYNFVKKNLYSMNLEEILKFYSEEMKKNFKK